MPTERFDVKLALEAQRSGEAAFAETAAGLKAIRDEILRFTDAEDAGATTSEAFSYTMKGLRDRAFEAGLAFGDESAFIREVRDALNRFREAEASGLPWDEALTAALLEQAGAAQVAAAMTDEVLVAAEEDTAAKTDETAATDEEATSEEEDAVATEVATTAKKNSLPWWVAIAAAIALVTALLAPMVAWLGSAVIVLTSWTVGAAAAASVMAAMTVGMGALSVGVLMLYDGFNKNNPALLKFQATWKEVGEDLAALAAGPAKEIFQFLDSLAPIAEKAGSGVIKWFGKELPGALAGINKLIRDLLPSFSQFGQFLGRAFDQMSKAGLGTMFEGGVKLAIQALEGLITNLDNIALWFSKNKGLQTTAMQIFGQLGTIIQTIGTIWRNFTDWIVANWPATMENVNKWIDNIKEGWKQWGPVIVTVAGLIWQFAQIGLQAIQDHAAVLVPLLGSAILVILALAAAFLIIVAALVEVADAFYKFIAYVGANWHTFVNDMINGINHFIQGLNHIPGVNIPFIPLLTGGGLPAAPPPMKGVPLGAQRHSGGGVQTGDAYVIGKPGAEEIFVPNTSGQITPVSKTSGGQSQGGGQLDSKILGMLTLIEDHLGAIRTAAPGITAASAVRRSG